MSLQIVATKMDKLPLNQHKLAVAKLKKDTPAPVVAFSAHNQLGKEVLFSRVLKLVGIDADAVSSRHPT
ncbi:MAG: hypothetical protein IPJ88_15100 [Myxococcales bacterium]|nr:MAG: hypothetical protein IPJ88_15100 [Myxococcales bacterium]